MGHLNTAGGDFIGRLCKGSQLGVESLTSFAIIFTLNPKSFKKKLKNYSFVSIRLQDYFSQTKMVFVKESVPLLVLLNISTKWNSLIIVNIFLLTEKTPSI